MRTRQLSLVLALASVWLWADGPSDRTVTDPKSVTSQQNAQAKPVNVEDLFYTTRIFSAAWSPNGAQIAYSGNQSGRFNIWTMKADGTSAQQVTKSNERQDAPVWSPDGKWIAYNSDATGENELYVRSQDGKGEPQQITNGADTYYYAPKWSPDSKKLAY